MTFNRLVVNNHPGMHGTPLIDGSKLLSQEGASWHTSEFSPNGLVAVWHESVWGWSVFLFDASEYE